jgi:hypothetical protein
MVPPTPVSDGPQKTRAQAAEIEAVRDLCEMQPLFKITDLSLVEQTPATSWPLTGGREAVRHFDGAACKQSWCHYGASTSSLSPRRTSRNEPEVHALESLVIVLKEFPASSLGCFGAPFCVLYGPWKSPGACSLPHRACNVALPLLQGGFPNDPEVQSLWSLPSARHGVPARSLGYFRSCILGHDSRPEVCESTVPTLTAPEASSRPAHSCSRNEPEVRVPPPLPSNE